MQQKDQPPVELEIFIPTFHEAGNLKPLLPWIKHVLFENKIHGKIFVVDATGDSETLKICNQHQVAFLIQSERGFGGALRTIWKKASAPWLLTMDADLSHPPDFIGKLWQVRSEADVTIASRYVPGGSASTSWLRIFLSRCLNWMSLFVLQTNIQDLTSNFRLYRTSVLKNIKTHRIRFDVLQEVLVRIMNRGYQIAEIPFQYEPRFAGASNVRLWSFGFDYLKAVFKDWRIRNSTDAVDYDFRAYNSILPLQRYWQQKRYQIINQMTRETHRLLDIGCGSSRIILDHPEWVGLDIHAGKLRFLKRYRDRLFLGDVSRLPFRSQSFDAIVCSQVIEHIQDQDFFWKEFYRVLKPNGVLILGTPDYGRPYWPFFEWLHGKVLPQGYMQEHCTHWTLKTLLERLSRESFSCSSWKYILGAELIIKAIKQPKEILIQESPVDILIQPSNVDSTAPLTPSLKPNVVA